VLRWFARVVYRPDGSRTPGTLPGRLVPAPTQLWMLSDSGSYPLAVPAVESHEYTRTSTFVLRSAVRARPAFSGQELVVAVLTLS